MSQTRTIGIVLAALLIGALAGYGGSFYQTSQLQGQLATYAGEVGALKAQTASLTNEIASLSQTLAALNAQLQQTPLPNASSFPSVAALYEKARDSVVLIRVVVGNGLGGGVAEGSGFVYDTEGRVVTNYHVVEGGQSIEVTFLDGSSYTAVLIGSDVYSDLAVLAVQGRTSPFEPLPLGDSSSLRVGDPVIAIGNPFGLSGSLTTGVVSQKGRSLNTQTTPSYVIPNVLQIDAAINPGNSGGPLLNYKGEVVGITTAILSETGSFSGVGFAIPSNTIKREVPVLIQNGRYGHSYLGITGTALTKEITDAMQLSITRGWLIVEVIQGGPAAQAGLRGGTRTITISGERVTVGGDVIVRADNTLIRNGDDLSVFLEEQSRPSQTITFTIIRDGVEIQISVKLGVRPPPSS